MKITTFKRVHHKNEEPNPPLLRNHLKPRFVRASPNLLHKVGTGSRNEYIGARAVRVRAVYKHLYIVQRVFVHDAGTVSRAYTDGSSVT